MHNTLQAIWLSSLVLFAYLIYCVSNPGGDGYVLSGVVGAILLIGGYTVGAARERRREGTTEGLRELLRAWKR